MSSTYLVKIVVDCSDGYHEECRMKLDEPTALEFKGFYSKLRGMEWDGEDEERLYAEKMHCQYCGADDIPSRVTLIKEDNMLMCRECWECCDDGQPWPGGTHWESNQ